MRIIEDDLSHPDVVALVTWHVAEAHANSPEGTAYVLSVDRLRDPALTIWTAWDDDALIAMAGLKRIAARHGEVKSMRTVPAATGRGIGARMLDHVIAEARARGYTRLSLETGGNEAFAPARRLYERAGFTRCKPFADYNESEFNMFYSREI